MADPKDTKPQSPPEGLLRPLGYAQVAQKKVKVNVKDAQHGVAASQHIVQKGEAKNEAGEKIETGFVKPFRSDQLIGIMTTAKGQAIYNRAQLEAAMCDFSRIALGPKRAPKSWAIKKENGEVESVISRAVEGFQSFEDTFDNTFTPEGERIGNYFSNVDEKEAVQIVEKLIEGKFFEAIATNYGVQEFDAHWGNIGFNAAGEVSVIDKDLAMASVAIDEGMTYGDNDKDIVRHSDFSTVSVHDLENILDTKDYKPHHTPLVLARRTSAPRSLLNTAVGRKLLAAEKNDPRCLIQKYKVLLKQALLSKEMVRRTFAAHITDPDILETLTEKKYQHYQDIKQGLLASPEFRRVFQAHSKEICEAIVQELNEYNQEYRKDYFERQIVLDAADIAADIHDHFYSQDMAQFQDAVDRFEQQYAKRVESKLAASDTTAGVMARLRVGAYQFGLSGVRELTSEEKALLQTGKQLIESVDSKQTMGRLEQAFEKMSSSMQGHEQKIEEELEKEKKH